MWSKIPGLIKRPTLYFIFLSNGVLKLKSLFEKKCKFLNLFDFEMTEFVCSGNSQDDDEDNYSDCELDKLRERKKTGGKK